MTSSRLHGVRLVEFFEKIFDELADARNDEVNISIRDVVCRRDDEVVTPDAIEGTGARVNKYAVFLGQAYEILGKYGKSRGHSGTYLSRGVSRQYCATDRTVLWFLYFARIQAEAS
jgi:hypothetical protein